MNEKYRIYLVGLKSEADTDALIAELLKYEEVADETQVRELLAHMPSMLVELVGIEEVDKCKSALESLGAIVSVKSVKPPRKMAPEASKPGKPVPVVPLSLDSLPELEHSTNRTTHLIRNIAILVLVLLSINAVVLIKISNKADKKKISIIQGDNPEKSTEAEMTSDTDYADTDYSGIEIKDLTGEIVIPINLGELSPSASSLEKGGSGDIAQAYALLSQGEFDQAEASFRALYAQYPNDESVSKGLAHTLVSLAWTKFNEKAFQASLKLLEDANAVNPHDAKIIKLMGYCHYMLEQYPNAAGLIEESLEMGDDDPNSHLMLAHIFYYNKDNMAKVIEHLSQASDAMPEREDVKEFLNKVLKESGIEGSFRKKESRHFNVKYSGFEDENISVVVLNLLDESYVRIGYELDYYPDDEITVTIYTEEEFRDVTLSPTWSGAIYDGRIKLPVAGLDAASNDELFSFVVHEYTHAAVHRMGKGKCPTWLNEGLAMFMEEKIASRQRDYPKVSALMPLYNLHGSFLEMPKEMAGNAYYESLLAVKYLVDNWSIYQVREIIKKVGKGESFDKVLHDETGIPYADFDARFRASVQ